MKFPTIIDYHLHLYYDASTIEVAKEIAYKAQELYGVGILTFHERLVGPHPMWSVELSTSEEKFPEVFKWMIFNHRGLTVFCHPNTGNDYLDHTDHVFWIGDSKKLKIEIFQS